MVKLVEIEIQGQLVKVSEEIAEVLAFTKTFADAEIALKYTTELMVEIFNNIYMRDIKDHYSNEKVSVSNWTHHTDNTFFRTAQLLDLKCDFEVENRHDGALRRMGN
jgi:hypothetical protein